MDDWFGRMPFQPSGTGITTSIEEISQYSFIHYLMISYKKGWTWLRQTSEEEHDLFDDGGDLLLKLMGLSLGELEAILF